MRKLLALAGIGGLAYWFIKDRLGNPDEFAFTELPAEPDPPPP